MSGSPPKLAFNKPWLTYSDQVALLQRRGLLIADPVAAAEFLSHINYYRFSGYCLAFESSRHQFATGVTFEQVAYSYEFDRVLRDLVTEALELVELDARTAVAHCFGQRHGAFGHINAALFFQRFGHANWLDKLRDEAKRSTEPFITQFARSYVEFPDLPIWMAAEVMSFGSLSFMFNGMNRVDQKQISARYHLQPQTLKSWLHHLVYVRNLCAHHARLWDRVFAIKADLPPAIAGRK